MKPEGVSAWIRLANVAEKASDMLARATLIPCIAGMGAMTIIVIVGVFFRYVLRTPLGWGEELSRYLMIWSALLAVSVGVRYREHVGISLLVERLPLKATKAIAIFVKLVILGFLIVLTVRGWQMAVRGQMQLSMSLNIRMFWPLLAVPVAGALTAVQVFLQALVDLKLGSVREIMGTSQYE